MDEYDGGDRHRLKDPFDLRELQRNGCADFEVENSRDPFGDDLNMDDIAETMENKKDFFKNISLKNIDILARSAENAMKDFDELERTMVTVEEGVQKRITRPGRGVKVKPGSKVGIHYSAVFEHHDEPFDTSVNNSRPFYFKLGHSSVIPGLDIAVESMEVKEMADFLIQPKLAYGVLGCEPRIPKNARVLFTIELLDVQETSKYSEIFDMTPEERAKLPFDEIYKAAEELKFDGKREFKAREYSDAVTMYSRAAKLLEQHFMTSNEDETRKNLSLYSIFNNLALCYLKLEKGAKAINSCKSALLLPNVDISKEKPYYLMSKAHFFLGKNEEAKSTITEARRISPNNSEITNLYAQIMEEIHDGERERKNLYKKMMALTVKD